VGHKDGVIFRVRSGPPDVAEFAYIPYDVPAPLALVSGGSK